MNSEEIPDFQPDAINFYQLCKKAQIANDKNALGIVKDAIQSCKNKERLFGSTQFRSFSRQPTYSTVLGKLLRDQEWMTVDLLKLFLPFASLIKGPDDHGDTPLHTFVAFPKAQAPLKITKMLLAAFPDSIRIRNRAGQTPLQDLIEFWTPTQEAYCYDVFKALVDAGSELLVHDEHGRTPLLVAIRRGLKRCAVYLLDQTPIDPERDQYLLFEAIRSNCGSVVESIIEKGPIRLDIRDDYGGTALHYAVHHGRLEILKLLLDTGRLYEDAWDNEGHTPLHVAARNGNIDLLLLLLQQNASALLRDVSHRLPIDILLDLINEDNIWYTPNLVACVAVLFWPSYAAGRQPGLTKAMQLMWFSGQCELFDWGFEKHWLSDPTNPDRELIWRVFVAFDHRMNRTELFHLLLSLSDEEPWFLLEHSCHYRIALSTMINIALNDTHCLQPLLDLLSAIKRRLGDIRHLIFVRKIFDTLRPQYLPMVQIYLPQPIPDLNQPPIKDESTCSPFILNVFNLLDHLTLGLDQNYDFTGMISSHLRYIEDVDDDAGHYWVVSRLGRPIRALERPLFRLMLAFSSFTEPLGAQNFWGIMKSPLSLKFLARSAVREAIKQPEQTDLEFVRAIRKLLVPAEVKFYLQYIELGWFLKISRQ